MIMNYGPHTPYPVKRAARAQVSLFTGADTETRQRFAVKSARVCFEAMMPMLDTIELLDSLPAGAHVFSPSGKMWTRERSVWRADTGRTGWSSKSVLADGPVRLVPTENVRSWSLVQMRMSA